MPKIESSKYLKLKFKYLLVSNWINTNVAYLLLARAKKQGFRVNFILTGPLNFDLKIWHIYGKLKKFLFFKD